MSASIAAVAAATIVLVHGAFADASGWRGVVKRLEADGYSVVAPANTLRSVSADADAVAGLLKTIKGPIVLVGHSYGGMVVTNAARGIANVKALVYVDAFVPDKGESAAVLGSKFPGGIGPRLAGAGAADRRRRSLHPRRPLPCGVRGRRRCGGSQVHGGNAAADHPGRLHRAVGRAGLEDGPELVRVRHGRSLHSAGAACLLRRAGACARSENHRRRVACPDDQPSRRGRGDHRESGGPRCNKRRRRENFHVDGPERRAARSAQGHPHAAAFRRPPGREGDRGGGRDAGRVPARRHRPGRHVRGRPPVGRDPGRRQ